MDSLYQIFVLSKLFILRKRRGCDGPYMAIFGEQGSNNRMAGPDPVVAYQIVPSVAFAHQFPLPFAEDGLEQVAINIFVVGVQSPAGTGGVEHFDGSLTFAQYRQRFCTEQRDIFESREYERA